MSMRSKASLTLAPIPHHHSEKASLSLHDQGWISSNSSPAPSLSTVLENVFQMKGRAKQHKSTLGPHQHAGGVQQRQLRPGFRPQCAPHTCFRPLCSPHTGFRPRCMCSLFSQSRHWMVSTFQLLHFFTKCRLKHVGVC